MPAPELLGPLEGDVMEVMWDRSEATVRDVLTALRPRRELAYTTVMTVMNNLVTKRLLERRPEGRAFTYRVALSREEFLKEKSREAVTEVLERFGDLAIARFIETVALLSPEDIERLRALSGRQEHPAPEQEDGTA